MRRAFLFAGAVLLVAQVQALADDQEPKKVQILVQSWLLPGTLASDLKSGKKVTAVEVKDGEATKVSLSEVAKGKDEMPKEGTYHQQKIIVHKGNKYATHDAYLSAPLPKGTKLKEFTYQGTFTGKIGDETHKFTFFEVTPVKP
jgi:hypothetical protein